MSQEFTDYFTSFFASPRRLNCLEMAKLDALKAKLQPLREKLEKIPVLKKFFAPSTPSAPPPPASPHSLGEIYKGGGVLTRLQVLFIFVFLLIAVASLGVAVKKFIGRLKSSDEHEKLAADYSHEIDAVKKRMEEKANLISLGQFAISAYVGEGKTAAMGLDIWIKVSDVQSANYADSHDVVLRDKAMDALNEIYVQKVDLLSEQGKNIGKQKLRDSLSRALPAGKVEEVFFYNMIVQ